MDALVERSKGKGRGIKIGQERVEEKKKRFGRVEEHKREEETKKKKKRENRMGVRNKDAKEGKDGQRKEGEEGKPRRGGLRKLKGRLEAARMGERRGK